jgi:hypothetical protein
VRVRSKLDPRLIERAFLAVSEPYVLGPGDPGRAFRVVDVNFKGETRPIAVLRLERLA